MLMKNFTNVLQSYTTNTNVEGVDYCVAAKALVKASEVAEFRQSIKRLKSDSSRPVGVSELKLLISNQ